MTIDSTSIVNQVKCYGKQLENNNDNSVTKYYFDQFIATNYESVGNWGPRIGDDISDERFTDAKSMKAYALSQMTTDPILSIEVTYDGNEQPIPGET
ncbi:phage tail protein, partial [Streptomyces brasiliscabiei]|uniref:phage tail protein n=1 Tax=Streptomyces brasiliscabiei TaxID=2736302 RepID=UPI0038F7D4D7